MPDRWRVKIFAVVFLLVFISTASAESWSRHYIESLPDSAFAAIETAQGGKKIRHLPHHNLAGDVDFPHLKSALGRIYQVKWIDPANHTKAKAHLDKHYKVYRKERAKSQQLKDTQK